MGENDDYTQVQRRLCAVMARSEWTSSRMRMQKSGEELRERRAKTHRTANEFLQGLLGQRREGDIIDDNGAVDRYHKFLKHKANTNGDDSANTSDEFDRRLRALNHRKTSQPIKETNRTSIPSEKSRSQDKNSVTIGLQSTNQIDDHKIEMAQQMHVEERPKPSRILPILSKIRTTSTPNETSRELTPPVFQDDDTQEVFTTPSSNASLVESQTNVVIDNVQVPLHHHHHHHHDPSTLSIEQTTEAVNCSTPSLDHSFSQTVYAPKARRPDGSVVVVVESSLQSSLHHASSNTLPLDHCCFPRALTLRGRVNTPTIPKRELPSRPESHASEQQVQREQIDTDQLFHFLDRLETNDNECSHADFVLMLDELTPSSVNYNELPQSNLHILNSSAENTPLVSDDDDDDNDDNKENISHLFDESSHRQRYYNTLTVNVVDPKQIAVYTMTLSTVQMSPSLLLPYSILDGRRPLLRSSPDAHFKHVRSTKRSFTCQVTAIESSINMGLLKQNDIILKIGDQSVWRLTTDVILNILQQYAVRSDIYSLTIARLCQPLILE